MGIREGYGGLLEPQGERDLIPLRPSDVAGITHLGGTILGTTNLGNPLKYPVRLKGGQLVEWDRSDELIRAFKRERIDALVAVGGDGSLAIVKSTDVMMARRG